MSGGFLSYFVRHRTAANLLLMFMLALGVTALTQIRAQFFPDVVVENIRVSVNWSGAAALDMDEQIVGVIEPAVIAVEGVDTTVATSFEGRTTVRVDFEPGWDMARALNDIETAVGQIIGELPDGSDDPVITRSAWRDRVTDVVISGPVTLAQLSLYADEFTARLFAQGVTRTTIRGIQTEAISVELNEARLVEYNITLQDIASVIGGEASASPAGDIADGSTRLRTGVQKRSVEDISQLVITTSADGRAITLSEIAVILPNDIAGTRSFFTRDNPALTIRVDRSAAGDAIGIQETVEQIAGSYGATLPEGVSVELTATRSQIISDRLNLLVNNGLAGLVLVVGLLFLFLSARTAFWVAAGIPVAMLATFALMFGAGLTLNMVSLFALIICLGIVVDDAIVVAEHADYRHRDLKEAPVTAATGAAERMSLPVLSATITTVLAFGSIGLIGGRFGDLIRDIPFTVPVVLLASLVECFLILPAHMKHSFEAQARATKNSVITLFLALSVLPVAVGFAVVGLIGLRPGFSGPFLPIGEGWDFLPFLSLEYEFPGWGIWSVVTLVATLTLLVAVIRSQTLRNTLAGPWYDLPSTWVNARFDNYRTTYFAPLMSWIIRLRYPMVAVTFVTLGGAVNLFQSDEVRWRFFNAPEQGTISGNVAMLPGTSRAETQAMVFELSRATRAVGERYAAETGTNPIVFSLTQVGGTAGRGLASESALEPDQLGSISIDLIDADRREAGFQEIMAAIEAEIVRPANLDIFAFRGGRFGPSGDNLDVSFTGADTATLKSASIAFQQAMAEFSEVSGLEDTLPYDKAELVLELTDQGRSLGFTTDTVGRVLRNHLNGIEAARFPNGSNTTTVTVRLSEDDLKADFLTRAQIQSPAGTFVHLSDIVKASEQFGFASIRRDAGLRTVTVTGEIAEDNAARADEITRQMRDNILPRIAAEFGVSYVEGGQADQQRNFLGDAAFGFMLAMLGIYLTLAWVFASWSRPFVVMAIIPFGLVGTIWGHYIWDVPMSIFTVVGLLGMTGIIINDSIVLITTIDEQAKKRALIPAVIAATVSRLRAVMLTTLTTVLGLVPLLYETSQQAQFLKPTVITLVYGLGFGMFIVLLIVPSIVVIQSDVGRLLRSTKRAVTGQILPGHVQTIFWSVLALQSLIIGATVGVAFITGSPLAVLPGEGLGSAIVIMLLGVSLTAVAGLALSSRVARKRGQA